MMECHECKAKFKTLIMMNKGNIEVCEECAKLEKFNKYKVRRSVKLAGPMTMLPPAAHLCQECAIDHVPSHPHDACSLYYQMQFKLKHDRFPTWKDAISHCDDAMKELWTEELIKRGINRNVFK